MGREGQKNRHQRQGVRQRVPPKNGAVAAKKHLGQHFLKDANIAQKIADTLTLDYGLNVLEIGPGTGILTERLLARGIHLVAMDIDPESVAYLHRTFRQDYQEVSGNKGSLQIVEADFLKADLDLFLPDGEFAITGNFPYNISSQILFRMLAYRQRVPEFSGMFQKEVAQRICAAEGNKTYGILSVLVQAFYKADYLFDVPPHVFVPPPKVYSGVLYLRRKANFELPCDEALFFKVVKTAFNQRRKTLRNSLKPLGLSEMLRKDSIFDRRPEQLDVDGFLELTRRIGADPS